MLRIASGDIIDVDTLLTNTPMGLQRAGVPPEKIQDSLKSIVAEVTGDRRGPGGHILTGPVYVDGAEPGDALEVKILSIDFVIDYAYNGCSGFIPANCDRSAPQKIVAGQRRRRNSRPGIVITRPLLRQHGRGATGEALDGASSNCRRKRAAVSLLRTQMRQRLPARWLAVAQQTRKSRWPRAAAADEEVDQDGHKTCTAGLPLTVRKDMKLLWPRAETSTDYISMATDEDLKVATTLAIQEMVDFLAATKNLSKHEAYQLVSVLDNVAVTLRGPAGVWCPREDAKEHF